LLWSQPSLLTSVARRGEEKRKRGRRERGKWSSCYTFVFYPLSTSPCLEFKKKGKKKRGARGLTVLDACLISFGAGGKKGGKKNRYHRVGRGVDLLLDPASKRRKKKGEERGGGKKFGVAAPLTNNISVAVSCSGSVTARRREKEGGEEGRMGQALMCSKERERRGEGEVGRTSHFPYTRIGDLLGPGSGACQRKKKEKKGGGEGEESRGRTWPDGQFLPLLLLCPHLLSPRPG